MHARQGTAFRSGRSIQSLDANSMTAQRVSFLSNFAITLVASAVGFVSLFVAQIALVLTVGVFFEGVVFHAFDAFAFCHGSLNFVVFALLGWAISTHLSGGNRASWVALFSLTSVSLYFLAGGAELVSPARFQDYAWFYFPSAMSIAGSFVGHLTRRSRAVVV